jgi:ribosome-binding ATPase
MFSVGLVGLPNAGKSTLFNLLTKRAVPAENFPFCTIEPNSGIVEVPDERVGTLAKMYGSAKQIQAAIEFKDIAGLVKNASQGAGLGNQFLSHIREADMILMVVRVFEHADIIHVENRVNPTEDEEILNLELVLADAKMVEKLIQNQEKDLKKGTDKLAAEKLTFLEKLMQNFEQNISSRELILPADTDQDLIKWRKSLNLLTDKPLLKLGNKIDGGKNLEFKSDLDLDILQEQELSELTPELRAEFTDSPQGLDLMIRACYTKLGLGTYLTAGPVESRAWTFSLGTKAPKVASVIHSDFENRFIRGEVIPFSDLISSGSHKLAKEQGKLQLVGKDYLVQDGDVCEWILR